jgi:hypothetical protein
LIKVPEGYYRRPSVLTADQQEIYTAWELNPPSADEDRIEMCKKL